MHGTDVCCFSQPLLTMLNALGIVVDLSQFPGLTGQTIQKFEIEARINMPSARSVHGITLWPGGL